jgi:hypothetical protein
MLFRAYAKMPGPGENRGPSSPGGTWVALEKVHGAQLVLGVQGGQVHFGKRKAWLSDEDPFFGWQLLRAKLGSAAPRVARAVGAEGDAVYLYGELFGGHYPHPNVPAVPGMVPVQTGIWYAPELHRAPFDILLARVASAVCRQGRSRVEPVLDEVVLDVRVDLELAFPLACRSLDPAGEDQLSAHIREKALPLVREALSVPRR